ncbi:unnamed protein product [Withania somnifera]
MAAHDNVGSKRHRRPNIRLGDIVGSGDRSSFDQRSLKINKAPKNSHSTNLSSNLVKTNPNVEEDANLDDVAIGNCKIKNLKSKTSPITKKMRSGWTPKAKDSEKDHKMLTTDVEFLENSPVHSHDRRISNVNGKKGSTRVSEDGQTEDTETNGVKVWLNQLGLGQYASMFEIHEVDDEVLPWLTLEDLKEMGINAVGSRRKMYCAIQNLNKGFS